MARQPSNGTCPDAPSFGTAEVEDAVARGWCAGVVVLAGRGSRVVRHAAVGWALRYASYDDAADRGVELPSERWIPMRPDTVFDLASLTKLFTAVLAAELVDPEEPVCSYLPEFRRAGKERITVRQLLDHTSGLRPELPFYDAPDAASRAAMLWCEAPVRPPGSARVYSDLNMIALGWALERVTGESLDVIVRDRITGPLGMSDTRFRPPAAWRPRIAATEDQRRPWGRVDRGLVHGEVHDENAWAMGGACGHAGLFSTAPDLAVFCRFLLERGGPYPGFETDQPWFMGELAGRGAVGHTGFTGTSLVIDPATGIHLILLANSVHPVRLWRDGSAPRAAVATSLARAALP
jgi:CubicO group peptidase (beta-lactamase class C family)